MGTEELLGVAQLADSNCEMHGGLLNMDKLWDDYGTTMGPILIVNRGKLVKTKT